MRVALGHNNSTLELRDPKMSAKMREVERTDGPGNHNKIDLIRPGPKNRDMANRVVLQADPNISSSWPSILGVFVHQLFPACRLVLLFH